jgi:DnaJ-class molecular chaperone
MAEDYYTTLGVRRDASRSEIEDAYRELTRKWHPDRNPDKDAGRKFQEIQAAFDVLSDQKKRDLYDRYGSSFESAGSSGPQGNYNWGGGAGPGYGGFEGEGFDFSQFLGERFGAQPGGGGGFGDFFSQFRQAGAGGTRRPRERAARRGRNIEHELTIPFATSVTGGKAQVSVERGSGKTETITVTIPPGIEDGKKIRLRGQGEPGPRGSSAGDILLVIHVAPHEYFQRRGRHLHLKVPVTLAEAALGAKIDVPTPQGTVALRIPPGTSSGTKLRVKGRGVHAKDGTAGDLLAEIQIVLPKPLDDECRRMIETIAAHHPQEDPRAKLRW